MATLKSLQPLFSGIPIEIFEPIRNASVDDFTALALIAFLMLIFLSRGILWDKADPFHYIWFEKPQDITSSTRTQGTRDIALKLAESVLYPAIFQS